jgi:hypothetical protein
LFFFFQTFFTSNTVKEKEDKEKGQGLQLQQEKIMGDFYQKYKLWFYKVVRSISIKPFFFSFFEHQPKPNFPDIPNRI